MPKKILLADDSITIQKVVELTFSEGDYQVFSVGNGSQALRKIHEVRPDIALLDVIMPEANGYEVCEKVKRNPETSWIPVLLLTGTFEPFDRKRADAAGANGHLTKPFESQMLISKVEELIASSRHPVIEPQKLGRMEIVAGGITRLEGEDPSMAEERQREADPREVPAREAGPTREAHDPRQVEAAREAEDDEEVELTRQSIVPDRFDIGSDETSPAAEGPRTVRISSPWRGAAAEAAPPQDPVAESAPEGTPETWDELASDLATASVSEFPRESSRPEAVTPVVPFSGSPVPGPSSEAPARGESAAPAEPAERVAPLPLTSDEMDRLAARILQQMSDKVIREIAWEIIPELAESLIKQRIRELEEKITREN
jgi:CheY-like chemotaxis protein